MSNPTAQDKSLDDIKVGDVASFERVIVEEDVATFARLSGDYNPLHTDVAYAEATPFGQRVVFGMLLGAFVSQLIGMQLPGRRALILKESLEFKKPVFIGDTIAIIGTVATKSGSTGILEIQISIKRGDEVMTEGSVHARVRP